MFALLKKEIGSFFSSLTGYIVILVFLIANSLFMWIFPGDMNILDSGYANMDSLFFISPWVFLFLVPAVTMRLFAEEKKSGTMELLLTRPVSDLNIVMAKYLAGLLLVLFALLPSLISFLSVYLLGNPIGNMDVGGTLGSYIGLFFLAAIYVAFGLFSSSLTENQIISFILSMVLAFVFYIGFDSLGRLAFGGSMQSFIIALGINDHYISMSRGVIDTRDVIYFGSIIAAFILATKLVLESRKW